MTAASDTSGDEGCLGTNIDYEAVGKMIGPYKLLALLGEGGFGTVWLAERREPMVQRVAIKVIKPGMDSKAVIARFEQERQALAVMNHPNLAKVLDAGTTNLGRPYFVMEYVKGEPITDYCDRSNLTLKQRLELVIPVCEAVQHAHMKGIIHRDIKPSNILVEVIDGHSVPKVIDFGVAKAVSHTLTEHSIFTEIGQLIGTPAYMSPEQAEMGAIDVDTRTDVYSLGVVLYELLSGAVPFDRKTLRNAGLDEIRRIIREVEPPKPSTRLSSLGDGSVEIAKHRQTQSETLERDLRRELEWIPLKAMRKDRTQRYRTPADLADDIRSYLLGKPLTAGPESVAYRTRKYLRRHRGPVTAATLVAVTLIASTTVSIWFALGEAKARKQADDRADETKKVASFQSWMLNEIDPTLAGVKLMQDLRDRFDAVLTKEGVPTAEREKQAELLSRMHARINARDAAAALIDRTILKHGVAAIDKDFMDQPVVDVQLRQTLADLYMTLGLFDEASPLQSHALDTRRRVLGSEDPDTLTSIDSMGALLESTGKLDEAEPYLREALEKRRRVLGEEHQDTLTSINNMGVLLRAQGKLAEADPYYREALEKRRRVLGDDHANTLTSISNMGSLLKARGKLAEAEPYYREALKRRRHVLGDESPDTLSSINNMGTFLNSLGKFAEAEPYYHEALEGRRRVLGDEHPETLNSINNIGAFLSAQRRHTEAEPYYREALEKRRRVRGDEHPETLSSISNMAFLLQAQGKLAEAEAYYREALEKRRRKLGDVHPDTLSSLNNLGSFLSSQDRLAEAEPYLREALESRSRLLKDEHPDTLTSINNMGMLLTAQERFALAEEFLLPAAALAKSKLGPMHVLRTKLPESLVKLYSAWNEAEPGKGYDAKAAQWQTALDELVQSRSE